MIDTTKLSTLLEPHFQKDLNAENYDIKKIKALKLLTYTRFDLAFKLLYLEMRSRDVSFAKKIYEEHIRAFSLGKFNEPGNDEKNSIEKFIAEFDRTFEDINANGFDNNRTLIPLSYNGSIANGAHRVASTIYLDKDIDCVQIKTGDHIYDYKFFYKRNVSSQHLDIVATKFVEYANNVYVALIWPTAQGYDEKIDRIIPNIIYKKTVTMNPNGAHNLITQIYYGEDWLGSLETNFRGSQGKLVECFKTFDPIRVIAFQAKSLNEVLKIKERIRDVFNVGKNSIHITDTKEEAIRVSRVVFNENSIHFINYAKPNKYLSTHRKLAKFKAFIKDNGLNSEDLLLDSGIVLSAYGLRESNDIDYFIDDNKIIKYHENELECHDDELVYHDADKLELIYNPENYFYFNDLKFVSFTRLYKMKKNRGQEKDINDCNMMEGLIGGDHLKIEFNKLKQRLYYSKIKIRHQLIKFLKVTRGYHLARKYYKRLR